MLHLKTLSFDINGPKKILVIEHLIPLFFTHFVKWNKISQIARIKNKIYFCMQKIENQHPELS